MTWQGRRQSPVMCIEHATAWDAVPADAARGPAVVMIPEISCCQTTSLTEGHKTNSCDNCCSCKATCTPRMMHRAHYVCAYCCIRDACVFWCVKQTRVVLVVTVSPIDSELASNEHSCELIQYPVTTEPRPPKTRLLHKLEKHGSEPCPRLPHQYGPLGLVPLTGGRAPRWCATTVDNGESKPPLLALPRDVTRAGPALASSARNCTRSNGRHNASRPAPHQAHSAPTLATRRSHAAAPAPSAPSPTVATNTTLLSAARTGCGASAS